MKAAPFAGWPASTGGWTNLGKPLYCKGRVTRKYVEDGRHLVDCDIWVEDAEGKTTTPGSATVELPSGH